MAGVMDKFWKLLGLGDEEDIEDEFITPPDPDKTTFSKTTSLSGSVKVLDDIEKQKLDQTNQMSGAQRSQPQESVSVLTKPRQVTQPSPVPSTSGKVLTMESKGSSYMSQPESNRLVVYAPNHFEEVQVLVDHMKANRPVIVSLEGLDGDLARSMLDFVCGAAYALEGSMQKVSGNIFLVAPSDVDVSSNLKEALLARDSLVRKREER